MFLDGEDSMEEETFNLGPESMGRFGYTGIKEKVSIPDRKII